MRPGSIMRQVIAARFLHTHVAPYHRVLDLGGFDGSVNSALHFTKARLIILDLDCGGLNVARANGLAAVRASAEAIPFNQHSIDVILSFDLVTSVPFEHEEKIFGEIGRVLRSDGRLLLTEVDSKFLLPFVDQSLVYQSWRVRPGLSYERLQHLVESGGMQILEHKMYYSWLTRFFYTVLFYWNLPRRGTRIKRQLWRLIVAAEDLWCPSPQAHLILARPNP